MNIQSDSLGYTVTLNDVSEYPLMSVYADNFNLANKVYTPIFRPQFDMAYCVKQSGVNTGYAIAMYVPKVNAAGQALDSDNKLCIYSGKKQDAYKYQSISSDGGYHIIGTYAADAEFDGILVKVYDPSICNIEAQGSITINGSSAATINLNSTAITQTVTIVSNASWQMISTPQFATVAPQQGVSGTTTVTVFHNNVGGTDNIVFQNRTTLERVTLTVNIYIIRLENNFTFANNTTQFTIPLLVMGGSGDYTYSVSPQTGITSMEKVDDGLLVSCTANGSTERNYTFTFTHASHSSEVKTTNVRILGNNTNPSWMVLSTYCEIS